MAQGYQINLTQKLELLVCSIWYLRGYWILYQDRTYQHFCLLSFSCFYLYLKEFISCQFWFYCAYLNILNCFLEKASLYHIYFWINSYHSATKVYSIDSFQFHLKLSDQILKYWLAHLSWNSTQFYLWIHFTQK